MTRRSRAAMRILAGGAAFVAGTVLAQRGAASGPPAAPASSRLDIPAPDGPVPALGTIEWAMAMRDARAAVEAAPKEPRAILAAYGKLLPLLEGCQSCTYVYDGLARKLWEAHAPQDLQARMRAKVDEGGDPVARVRALWSLDPAEARRVAEEGIEKAPLVDQRCDLMGLLAQLLLPTDPKRAHELMRRSIDERAAGYNYYKELAAYLIATGRSLDLPLQKLDDAPDYAAAFAEMRSWQKAHPGDPYLGSVINDWLNAVIGELRNAENAKQPPPAEAAKLFPNGVWVAQHELAAWVKDSRMRAAILLNAAYTKMELYDRNRDDALALIREAKAADASLPIQVGALQMEFFANQYKSRDSAMAIGETILARYPQYQAACYVCNGLRDMPHAQSLDWLLPREVRRGDGAMQQGRDRHGPHGELEHAAGAPRSRQDLARGRRARPCGAADPRQPPRRVGRRRRTGGRARAPARHQSRVPGPFPARQRRLPAARLRRREARQLPHGALPCRAHGSAAPLRHVSGLHGEVRRVLGGVLQGPLRHRRRRAVEGDARRHARHAERSLREHGAHDAEPRPDAVRGASRPPRARTRAVVARPPAALRRDGSQEPASRPDQGGRGLPPGRPDESVATFSTSSIPTQALPMRANRIPPFVLAAVLIHANLTPAQSWDPDVDPIFAGRPRSTGFPEPRACPGSEPILKQIADQLESFTMPVYPADALAQGWENDVELHVEMDETGKVTGILPRTGDSPFQDAAWRAVHKWKWKPCLRPDGKPTTCSIDLTVCFAGGKVTVTGVYLPPPLGAAAGPPARWRSLVGQKGYPKPPPHGTVAWALNVKEAVDAARRHPASTEALLAAYVRVFIAYGDCYSCRKGQYHALKDALRSYFNDQAAINKVQAEEYAEDAAVFPGGASMPGASCDRCKELLSYFWDPRRPVGVLLEYLSQCYEPLEQCPNRDELWWGITNLFSGTVPQDPSIGRTLLDAGPPPTVRPRVLLALADALRTTNPEAALDLDRQAFREPDFPATRDYDMAGRLTAAEARGDFETALFLMLVAGPPMVFCGNDVFSIPEYQFHVAYLQLLLGMEPRRRWQEMLQLVPDDPSSFVLAHFLYPRYLDQLEQAARVLHEEKALAAKLDALRARFAEGAPLAVYGNPRDAEQLLGGYISELRHEDPVRPGRRQ